MGSDSDLIRTWCVFIRGVGVGVGVGADLDNEFFGCDVWVLFEVLGDFLFLFFLFFLLFKLEVLVVGGFRTQFLFITITHRLL